MTSSLFMDADELAAEADCTAVRVEELARAGIIPGLKWGRSWRFVRADAPQFLAEIARQEAEERRSKKKAAPPTPPRRQRRNTPPPLTIVTQQ